GAWFTLCIVAALVGISMCIRKHYNSIAQILSKLIWHIPPKQPRAVSEICLDTSLHTVVLFASNLKNLTLNSVEETIKLFGNSIDHFVLMQVGLIDAGNFKGQRELEKLQEHTYMEVDKIASLIRKEGYSVECLVSTGLDIGDEVARLAQEVHARHPSCIFVGGQLVFPHETIISRWLHNQTLYIIQRRIHELAYPFITIPVYME
ncbi:MAG: hypothetical protein JSR46_08785, partial [Verrucomicrobia bacterium]|nr:hypothetical protein [Verrucomicrobiota bacterium]